MDSNGITKNAPLQVENLLLNLETQSQLTPNAIAVIYQDRQWTYQQLNAQANQLANYLKKQGVGPEVKVGICAERSLKIVVGILGILKASGAYVPIDPAYPKERQSFILAETQLGLLLTQSHLVEGLPSHSAQVICLDEDWETIALESEASPTSNTTPENLAYVMYTSGSTGKPKGVQITHSNVWYYIGAISNALEINAEDIYLHTASFSFSASLRQLIVPLSKGATSVIATREQIKNPLSLFELIQKQGVTVIDTVPSIWHYGLNALENLDPERAEALLNFQLRIVLLMGELTPCQLFQKLRRKLKNKPKIFNVYGQTETIGICFYTIPDDFDWEKGYLPIGYCYPHNQAYILDENLQPLAVGEIGELHVGGACIARGYLNLPDLNAKKFIANPFVEKTSIISEPRLFKTGDLARWLPNGSIELLGRVDFQVKIRGMRVEIGDVELAIAQQPGVKETVVIAREDVQGEKRLVAYVVPNLPQGDRALLESQLRDALLKQVPDYMIPSAFVWLESLPLTPNGKLDRMALPAPEKVRSHQQSSYVAPRNQIEQELTKIWEDVLDIKPISIKDKFFDIGGQSLLAVSIFSQITKKFNQELPLATLFQAATIEEQAEILLGKKEPLSWRSLVPIQVGGSKRPIFCVHALSGNVLYLRDLAKHLGPEQPFYGLQARGLDGKQPPLTVLEDIAANYIQEIRTIQPEGPYILAGHSLGGAIAFEMAQQLLAAGEKIAMLALFDSYSPEVLRKGTPPLTHKLRVEFLNLSRMSYQQKSLYILERIQLAINKISKKFDRFSTTSQAPAIPTAIQLIEEANLTAIQNYSVKMYPGKITLFQSLQRWTRRYHQTDMGWGSITTGGVEIHRCPGNHFSMILEPLVSILASKFKECLDKIDISIHAYNG